MKNTKYYQVSAVVGILAIASVVFFSTKYSINNNESDNPIIVETGESNEIKIVSENDDSNEINSSEKNTNTNNLYTQYLNNKIGNIICNLETTQEGGDIKQTLYISGIRMKMESSVTYNGKTNNSYILTDGEFSYVWGGGQFIKMKVDEDTFSQEDSDDTEFEDNKDLKDYLNQMPYNKCREWKVDEKVFEVPDEDFIDLSGGFNIPFDETIQSQDYDQVKDNPYENMDDIKKLQDLIPEQYRDNKYVEPEEDKFPSTSGL